MHAADKPRWQQATALVSLGAGGIAGFAFVPRSAASLMSPASMPVHLLALEHATRQEPADDGMLRAAVVNVARYYLRMARSRTPAAMEALIWQHDSVDGVDHGESCAAFASLTLELAAQAVGQQSWVTGGTSYPWPLHKWADVRVEPNASSPGIVSVLQDAQAHHRWHPLGDGYAPLPGDWVLFPGHVEVVTGYSGGVLDTIGGDSLPNFSVNAHSFAGSLAADGVVGFVNNGAPPDAGQTAGPGVAHGTQPAAGRERHRRSAARIGSGSDRPGQAASGQAQVPGASPAGQADSESARPSGAAGHGEAAIPGLAPTAQRTPATRRTPAGRTPAAPDTVTPARGTAAQAAFIRQVAPGALRTQRTYGVPAAVTIAQAIDESGWGASTLAVRDHNLFGMKGTGPAGTDPLPAREYAHGRWVHETAPFRVYRTVAESIDDHGRLLATSGYYRAAMANRDDPDSFAAALTGVYATDPGYGAKLIGIMRQFDLYRFDAAGTPAGERQPAPARAAPGRGSRPAPSRRPARSRPSEADIPGLPPAPTAAFTTSAPAVPPGPAAPSSATGRRATRATAIRYRPQLPVPARNAFVTMAKVPLTRAEPLYRDVARHTGIPWQMLAAADWMQCRARPRYSPVRGERLGAANPDGTVYRTKSAALEQCAEDLADLAQEVYGIDLTASHPLSVGELADAFAGFRWGGLLRLHRTSALEFPYSAAGLTIHHLNMRWPNIDEPNAPDRPGSRFRGPIGAVPIVLSLNYPALA